MHHAVGIEVLPKSKKASTIVSVDGNVTATATDFISLENMQQSNAAGIMIGDPYYGTTSPVDVKVGGR